MQVIIPENTNNNFVSEPEKMNFKVLSCSHFVKSSFSDSVELRNLFSMFAVVRKDFFG